MIPQVKIEFEFTAGTWTDLSARFRRADGLTITRGRQGVVGPASPGQCSFTLQNDDGALTPGLSVYALRRWVPVRVSVWVSGDWSRRFTGYVDSGWPVAVSRRGLLSTVTLTCVDRMSLDSLRTLDSRAVEVLRSWGATYHWPLTADGTEVGGGPSLLPVQVGTGGELQWGQGEGLPSTEGGVLQLANAAPAGLLLRSAAPIHVERPWTVVCLLTGLSATGVVWWLEPAGNPSGGAYMTYHVDGLVTAWAEVGADTTPVMRLMMVTTEGDFLRMRGSTHTATTMAGIPSGDMRLYVAGGPSGSGTALMSGAIGHVAIIPRQLTPSEMEQLAHDLESATIDPSKLLAWGGAGAATISGAPEGLRALPTSGQSAQSLIDTLAKGGPARYAVGRDGTPVWRPVGEVPAAVSPESVTVGGLTYGPDLSGYITDVDVAMADGTTWRWTNPAAGLARPSESIEQAWEDPARAQSAARWIGSASDAPRLDGVGIDMLPLSDADTALALSLDIGSWLTVDDLPSQIPVPQTVIVEGYTESIGKTSWSLALSTSTAPNFFIIGSSLLDGPDILAP